MLLSWNPRRRRPSRTRASTRARPRSRRHRSPRRGSSRRAARGATCPHSRRAAPRRARGKRVRRRRGSRASIAASPSATTAPPFEGAGHVTTRIPSNVASIGVRSIDAVRRDVGGVVRHQLRHGGAHLRRAEARAPGPSPPSPPACGSRRSPCPPRCARESGRGSRAGTAAGRTSPRPCGASSSAGSNSSAHASRPWRPCASARPRRGRERQPTPAPTWKTCVDASPKSISTSSIGSCGRDGTAKKQSSSVGSAPASRTRRNRRPQAPSAAPRRRMPPVRRRRRHRRRSRPAPAPRRRLRRCVDSRLQRLRAWLEPSRAVVPGTRRRRRAAATLGCRRSRYRGSGCRSTDGATCSDSERIPGIALPGTSQPT